MRLRQRPWPIYILATAVYVFLYTPIIHVVINSFNANSSLVGWGGFTLHWYSDIWAHAVVLDGTRNSVIISVLVTMFSVVLGTAGAVAVQRAPRWVRAAMNAITYARIIMPELVLAIALLIFLTAVHIPRGILGTVIGHVVWASAYVTVIVAARLTGRDPATDEAARDLGATRWRAFWRVTLPDLMPAIAASALLVFAFSFEDVVTSYFLSGDQNTLPMVILSLIRYEVNPGVNAIGAALIAVTALVLVPYILVTWQTLVGPGGPKRR